MNELGSHMAGKVMAFKRTPDADDPVCDQLVLVDVTDLGDGEIEFGFDCENPRRRVYLRLPIHEVERVLAAQKEPK